MQESSQLSAEDPEMAQLFTKSLQLNEERDTQKAIIEEQELYGEEEEEEDLEENEEDDYEEEDEEEEEEFSFFCDGANTSPIAAEDAFVNGQIKPIYPLFNQDLLLQETDLGENFPMNPQVKKVFVEMKKESSASSESDEISGPYCEFSKKPMSEPEGCKKSNSTGFSKLWRFKDFLHRSNSDGRDAFVFLNNHQTTSSGHQTVSSVGTKQEEIKVKRGKEKVKKSGKKKTASLSAHEVYLKNKAKENDRRKSYLPYRPEVFGFFTNVNGGMSKNVHPF